MHKFLLYITLFLIISCSSEKGEVGSKKSSAVDKKNISETIQVPAAVTSASYSLEIIPADASRNSTLSLITKGFELKDAKIEWLVNGDSVASPSPEWLKLSEVKKGSNVQAKATIQDKEIFSNTILIKNAPPEISKIKFTPEIFKPGDVLGVDVAGNDIDGDKVTFIYEWTKNKEPAGSDKQIGAPIKRGDKISVKITPFDGEAYGKPIVLQRDVKNVSPIINEHTNFNFNGKTYTYQVNATDPDEDTLTYSLKSAPANMAIDPKTGAIRWDVPPDVKGKTTFTVSVTDGNGGEATQSLTFEIKQ